MIHSKIGMNIERENSTSVITPLTDGMVARFLIYKQNKAINAIRHSIIPIMLNQYATGLYFADEKLKTAKQYMPRHGVNTDAIDVK